jgi:two-component system sensor histidine kinase PilS (NtrC family)
LVRRESTHLGKLVSDFLTFARPPPPALREGDLGALVEECCDAFEPEAISQGRTLLRHVHPAPCRFDPDQMRQVVGNLLRNALEATTPGGVIEVSVEPSGNGSAVIVEDDGPGVPQEAAAHLFEPFFTTKEKGTGLGLALVARIAGSHGGTVDVENRAKNGARFVVWLPGTHYDGT